jgi:branched-chain amino acid transport system substrate-binding protein
LELAQGIVRATAFDWDMNGDTSVFRHASAHHHNDRPNCDHAGSFSAVTHYLKATVTM